VPGAAPPDSAAAAPGPVEDRELVCAWQPPAPQDADPEEVRGAPKAGSVLVAELDALPEQLELAQFTEADAIDTLDGPEVAAGWPGNVIAGPELACELV